MAAASFSDLKLYCTYALVSIWWLVVTAFVADPYLAYLEVANPDDSTQVPPVWKLIRELSNFGRSAFYLPFLICYPHSDRLTTQQNWLLHGIGIAALALGLVPLCVGPTPATHQKRTQLKAGKSHALFGRIRQI